MSSISSIGGASNLYQYLQNASAAGQTSSTAATTATTATDGTDATDGASSGQAVQGGHHHHHHHGQGSSSGAAANSQLFQQIQQAVTSALQSAGTNNADPNKTIEDAISQVFQNNNSAQTGSTTNPNDPSATANSAATTGTTTGGTTGADGTSALQAFFQALQNAGINPQQFHQDLLTAVQDAQNGNANPATAFQSLPPGSIIDTLG